jgi:multidrug efflux pump subunit AcrA (membrane-fusion protein)
VVPLTVVDVKAQVTSTVRQVHFKEGQFVKAGQLLFSLDARTEEANLSQGAGATGQGSRSAWPMPNASLERAKQLLAQNFVSQVAVDTAQTQVDSWGATLDRRRGRSGFGQGGHVVFTHQCATFSGRAGAVATCLPAAPCWPTRPRWSR